MEKGIINKYKEIFWICIGSILVFYPMWTTGVIHNDELIVWFERQQSYGTVLWGRIQSELGQGRILRIMAPVNESIGFLTDNMIVNRIIQSGLIIGTILLGGYFVYRVTKSKKIAYISALIFFSFLPYTFEPSVPQAYVGLTVIPMMEVLMSAILYIDFLETKEKKRIIESIFIYIIALLGYEYILTFVLIFPILYIVKGEPLKNLKNFGLHIALYASIGILYLIAMLIFKSIMPGNYDGASIGFVSIKSSLQIIINVIKSSLPGYFLWSGKYKFLFQYYTGYEIISYIKDKLYIENLFSIRILLYGCWSGISYFLIEKKVKEDNNSPISVLWIFGGCYLIIPILPNAISAMYQGMVGENGFVSLTINYYIFFVISMLIAGTIIKIKERCKIKYIYNVLLIVLIFGSIIVQIMNETFMKQSTNDFERYSLIEQTLKTDLIKNYDNQEIYSPDIYETRNTLAIRDGYWTDYARKISNLNIDFNSEDNDNETKMYYLYDKYLCLTDKKNTVVFSEEKLSGTYLIRMDEKKYKECEFDEYIEDNSLYCYVFTENN